MTSFAVIPATANGGDCPYATRSPAAFLPSTITWPEPPAAGRSADSVNPPSTRSATVSERGAVMIIVSVSTSRSAG